MKEKRLIKLKKFLKEVFKKNIQGECFRRSFK